MCDVIISRRVSRAQWRHSHVAVRQQSELLRGSDCFVLIRSSQRSVWCRPRESEIAVCQQDCLGRSVSAKISLFATNGKFTWRRLIGSSMGSGSAETPKFVRKFAETPKLVRKFAETPKFAKKSCCFFRMCKLLGQEFVQYLPVVMGPLMKAASIKPEVAMLDSQDIDSIEEDDGWEFIKLGDQVTPERC